MSPVCRQALGARSAAGRVVSAVACVFLVPAASFRVWVPLLPAWVTCRRWRWALAPTRVCARVCTGEPVVRAPWFAPRRDKGHRLCCMLTL